MAIKDHSKHCMRTLWGKSYKCDCYMGHIKKLEADNKRLREALSSLLGPAVLGSQAHEQLVDDYGTLGLNVVKEARKALEGK